MQSVLAHVTQTASIKRKLSPTHSSESMPSKLKPVKQLQKKHHAASTESDSSIVASNLGQQGFGTSFEDKMLELNLQILEEI